MTEVAAFTSHPATWSEEKLLSQCVSRRQRRSGPGGQHRNKVETAVIYLHEPSSLTGSANEKRAQEANRKAALFRLRVNLALQIRCTAQTDCSQLWLSRTNQGRLKVRPTHTDFPALLSEALDAVMADSGSLELAAVKFQCTKSQLFKFLRLEPRAARQVNDLRIAHGMKRLK